MKKVIVAVLLLALIAGCAVGAAGFRGKTAAIRAQRDAAVGAAEERLALAREAYAAVDPNALDGEAERLAAEQSALADALAQAGAMESENKALADEAARAEAGLETLRADEENAYYLSIYQALQAGMEKVEALIEGN